MELSLLGLPLEKWQLMIFSIPIPSVVALASVSREIRVKAIEQVIWAKLFERDFDTSKEQIQDKCKLIKDWRLLYKHFYKNSICLTLKISPTKFELGDQVSISVRMENLTRESPLHVGLNPRNPNNELFRNGCGLESDTGIFGCIGMNFDYSTVTSDFHTPIPFYGPTESTIYTQAKRLYLEGVDKFGLVAATRLVRFFLPLSNAEEDVRAVFSSTREFLKAPLKASQVTKCWQGRVTSNTVRVTLQATPKKGKSKEGGALFQILNKFK